MTLGRHGLCMTRNETIEAIFQLLLLLLLLIVDFYVIFTTHNRQTTNKINVKRKVHAQFVMA